VWWLSWLESRRLFGEHRQLLWQFTCREVLSRYRGSWLGVVWSLLNPLIMLALYTFVFSTVFEARWGGGSEPATLMEFALPLFSGLVAFNLFAETVNAAPGLILSHVSYVKRVVFPLEVLPVAKCLSGTVQAACSLMILLIAVGIDRGPMWSWVHVPLVFLPVWMFSLGASMFLASLGVFIRDIGNLVGVVTTMLMFLSPVFFPESRLPESLQGVLWLNPLAPMIENVRACTVDGLPPNWAEWAQSSLIGLVVMLAGYTWFHKSKNAFADVL
jgi:lipopolysaccharide transport system permease protein